VKEGQNKLPTLPAEPIAILLPERPEISILPAPVVSPVLPCPNPMPAVQPIDEISVLPVDDASQEGIAILPLNPLPQIQPVEPIVLPAVEPNEDGIIFRYLKGLF
jgi:hypothetical protein